MCQGIRFAGIIVTNLSYADELVIIANSYDDLANALLTLSMAVKRLRLEINFEKCKIIFGEPGTKIPHKWTFTKSDGMTSGTMEKVKNYKYLGAQ